MRTVTGISVPPPGAMAAALRRPRQLRASWYMAAFAVPGLAERVFAVPAGSIVVAARWCGCSSGPARPATRAERDAAGLADPAALTAALNWYRAIPLVAARPGPAGRPHPRCSSGATATPP